MRLKVCFVYPWATYGGVERVLLNRAQAFADSGMSVSIDVCYGADGGGLAPFEEAIRSFGLESHMRVVRRFEPDAYDAVFVIDAPGMLPRRPSRATRWIVECHTAYVENRAYLGELPPGIDCIAVPSQTFAATVRAELPDLSADVRLLRNFVAPMGGQPATRLPAWTGRPLLYFGRLDEHKNPQGFLDLFVELERRNPARHFGALLGPVVPGYDFAACIDRAGLRGKVVQLPPLTFLRTAAFLFAWRQRGGLMVSPSFGESFGLSAAESIAAGVPVLLSDIPEHAELVQGDPRHLYDPRDACGGADRIERMLVRYEESSERMHAFATRFSSEAFLGDWHALLAELSLTRSVEGPSAGKEVGL